MTDQQENKLELAVTNLGSKLITGPTAKRTFEESWLRGFLIDNQGLKERYLLDFLHKSQLTGANPALGQIFLTTFFDSQKNEKVGVTLFSYEFLRARAVDNGIDMKRLSCEYHSMEDFNPIKKEMELVALATAKYTNNDGVEIKYKAYFDEYNNPRNPLWRSKAKRMIEKCAEAGMLRRLCPQAMAGIFMREEMERENEKQVTEVENLNDLSNDILAPAEEKESIAIEVKSAKHQEEKTEEPVQYQEVTEPLFHESEFMEKGKAKKTTRKKAGDVKFSLNKEEKSK